MQAAQQLNATGTFGVDGVSWNDITEEALLVASSEQTFGVEPSVFVAHLQANAVWNDVRTTRNIRLQDCDWTVGNDSPLSDTQKDVWQTYRQALRDVTTQSNPTNITWPTKPGA
jgi:hypothetical protein